MAYRDEVASCPACGTELRRRQRRDVWRCAKCGALHVAQVELERWLHAFGPDGAAEVVAALRSAIRRAAGAKPAELSLQARRCATCARPMVTTTVLGAELWRCEASDQLWLPEHSHQRLMAHAERRQRASRSWIGRILAYLYAS